MPQLDGFAVTNKCSFFYNIERACLGNNITNVFILFANFRDTHLTACLHRSPPPAILTHTHIMAAVRMELPSDEQSWTKLLEHHATLPQPPVLIKVDSVLSTSIKDSPSIPDTPQMGERKPSFLNSVNRSLRSSFRAVTDSPGAIQRYVAFLAI